MKKYIKFGIVVSSLILVGVILGFILHYTLDNQKILKNPCYYASQEEKNINFGNLFGLDGNNNYYIDGVECSRNETPSQTLTEKYFRDKMYKTYNFMKSRGFDVQKISNIFGTSIEDSINKTIKKYEIK